MVKLDSVNKLLLKSILYSEEALQTNFKFHHWAIYLLPCTSGEKKGKERKEKKKKKKVKTVLVNYYKGVSSDVQMNINKRTSLATFSKGAITLLDAHPISVSQTEFPANRD